MHHGSVLGPLFFTIVMEAVTEYCEKEMKEFLYVNDLVIVAGRSILDERVH